MLTYGAGMEGKASARDHVGRRQKLAVDWDRTLAKIRQLEGFENFLRGTPFAQIKEATSSGPVILVNMSEYGSDAIIVHKTAELVSIQLPKATPSNIEALARTLSETTLIVQRNSTPTESWVYSCRTCGE
ncbi:hypothetical protein FRB97_006202 [Tulasnella sp. 331]|nr:hypothetical protein FRB97_006202 [Tulasnella sp. 331]